MAEKSELQNLKTLVWECNVASREIPEHTIFVSKVCRYRADPIHFKELGVKEWNTLDVYQITFTDGAYKRKAILHPSLASHVQSGLLLEGKSVILKACQLRYDESCLQKRSYLIIHDLSIGSTAGVLDETETIWCDDCDDVERSDGPLTSCRGYFLNIWSSAELEGAAWNKGRLEEDPCDISPVDLYTLSELSSNWNLKNPPIIVRILSRKRIIHYAKNTKSDKWPLQAHFTISDRSGCATLVLWNALCAEYYHRLQEGDVLLLQRFTVKRSFHGRENYPSIVPDGLPLYDIDINLNSHHPVGLIKRVHLPSSIHIPPVSYNFITRTDLGNLPNGYICDIVGLVTYVGRYCREKMTGKCEKPDTGGYWIYRWIELIDHTSQKPFKVLLYRPAEIDISDQILPGNCIRCRHMRVVSRMCNTVNSRSDRCIYLTTTTSSLVDIVSDDPLIQKRPVDYAIGGYYSFPPILEHVTDIQNGSLKITSSEEFMTEVQHLVYKENKRFFILAHMVAVCYFESSKNGEVKSLSQDKIEEVIVSQSLYNQFSKEISYDVSVPFKQSYSGDGSELQFESPPHPTVVEEGEYLVILWSSLNNRILLPTVWCLNSGNGPSSPMTEDTINCDIVQCLATSRETMPAVCKTPKSYVNAVLNSATNCHHQFLLVIDVYKSTHHSEIVLNKAYKL